MTLNELIQQAQQRVKDDPSRSDLPVYQMSCFDDPLAFSTEGTYEATIYYTDDATFVDREQAYLRAEESGTEVVEIGRAIVIQG